MSSLLPTLFLAHGSPMNALGGNRFSDTLTALGKSLPRPKNILVISAHWRTSGPQVLKEASPKTIYDFSGFPAELNQITYAAPGAVELADRVTELLSDFGAQTTDTWGYDHGTWSVLRHLYPDADIPLTQLGISKKARLADHYQIAAALKPLRREGTLIIGSGNLTHNLGQVDWEASPKPQDWAVSFDEMVAKAIEEDDHSVLLQTNKDQEALWKRAHPTLEHYIPLLYAKGAADKTDQIRYPYVGMDMGTLSMRCVQFG